MQDKPFLITLLIQIAALRSVWDVLVKPAFLLSVAILVRIAVDFALLGQLSLGVPDLALATTLTFAPFLATGLYVVTYLDRSQVQLSEQALSDPLTRLPNRRAFVDRTEWLIAAIERPHKGTILVLDADRFKNINDSWGHATGDACLKLIAERLRTELRASDLAGRIGGEEFAVFLPGASVDMAEELGWRLCRPIHLQSLKPAGKLSFTLSVGVAPLTAKTGFDDALNNAEIALYRAKKNGRARVEVWTQGMRASAA